LKVLFRIEMMGQNAPVSPQIPVLARGGAGPVMAQSSLALYHYKGEQGQWYVIGKRGINGS
jgi:hypothetical protein